MGKTKKNKAYWQDFSEKLFATMKDNAKAGALLWNFDAPSSLAWSMRDMAKKVGINWNTVSANLNK